MLYKEMLISGKGLRGFFYMKGKISFTGLQNKYSN